MHTSLLVEVPMSANKVVLVLFSQLLAFSAFAQEWGGLIHQTVVRGEEVPSSRSQILRATPKLTMSFLMNQNLVSALCTGTLIAPDVVLTAAHCVNKIQASEQLDVNFADRTEAVQSIVIHPQYTLFSNKSFLGFQIRNGGENDIALIFLKNRPSTYVPALLPDASLSTLNGLMTLVVGYGKIDHNTSSPQGKLRWAVATLREAGSSRLLIVGGQTTCQGDSGGPSYANQKGNRLVVVGVHSLSDCDGEAYDTKVADYVSWIQLTILKYRQQTRL